MSLGWPGRERLEGPPGRAGGSVWGEGSLGISAQTAASLRDPVPDQADEEEDEEKIKQLIYFFLLKVESLIHQQPFLVTLPGP
ncbi:hypothetical protein L3Q82_009087 [Scortum barcoo]|uniref:Uncharacterized protein n=1 Tax=Scortum barcoo TaxID=214431 RepID=A0ACB8XAQ2_9TELE|nr:hypothetical protein L3Q82_009087 [Scortum barcoo]